MQLSSTGGSPVGLAPHEGYKNSKWSQESDRARVNGR